MQHDSKDCYGRCNGASFSKQAINKYEPAVENVSHMILFGLKSVYLGGYEEVSLKMNSVTDLTPF